MNDKSFEDDIPPVNYQMGISEVQYFISHCVHAGHSNLSLDAEILQSSLIRKESRYINMFFCSVELMLIVSYTKICGFMT